jgi:hypothetical protein
MIHDTISIGPMLSARYPEYSVVPDTPTQRAAAYILEDFFNHWLGRSCIHTRWCYPDNVDWVGLRLAANIILGRSNIIALSDSEKSKFAKFGQTMYHQFGKQVCEHNGVQSEHAAAVRADFELMLDALGQHLEQNEFLLGPRPCLADFALAGACKAHFITDPEPRSWLGEHEDLLVNYTERFFSSSAIELKPWLQDDQVPNSLSVVLDYLKSSYLKSAQANIAAGLKGEKHYECDIGYGLTKARTQRRLNKARLHVRDELSRIDAANHDAIAQLFGDRGILQHYLND